MRGRAQQALSREVELARVGPVEPRDHVEERRLAGAVRADQADDLPLLDVERDVVDRDDAAEAARDVADRRAAPSSLSLQRRRIGHRQPAGEALADVDRGSAVDLRASLRAAGRRSRARTRPRRWPPRPRAPPGRPAQPRRRRSPARGAARGAGRARRASSRTPIGDARQRVAHETQHRDAALLELVVAPDPAEPEQDVGEHRVAARRRVVVELLLARDQLLAVARCLEEAAARPRRRTGRSRAARADAPRGASRGSPLATCSSISPLATSA